MAAGGQRRRPHRRAHSINQLYVALKLRKALRALPRRGIVDLVLFVFR